MRTRRTLYAAVPACAWTLAYLVFGRAFAATIHSGAAPAWAVAAARARPDVSLARFLAQADKLAVITGLTLLLGAWAACLAAPHGCGTAWGYARRQAAGGLSAACRQVGRALRHVVWERHGRVTMLLLGGAFAVIYFLIGLRLAAVPATRTPDVLFDADVAFVGEQMTAFGAPASETPQPLRPARHPLFVLLVTPAGALLARVLRADAAAILLTSLAGGLAVALAYRLFSKAGPHGAALPAALAFGFSATQLLFSAVPETYAFATCSLLLACLAWIHDRDQGRVNHPAWLVIGVLAFGLTATNFVVAAVFFAASVHAAGGEGRPDACQTRAAVVAYAGTVLGIAVVLAFVQRALAPHASLFFLPFGLAGNVIHYVGFDAFAQPFAVLPSLAAQLVAYGTIAPEPSLAPLPRAPWQALSFAHPATHSAAWFLAAMPWFALLVAAGWSAARRRDLRTPFGIAILLCMAYQVALSALVGVAARGRAEVFLYASHVTPLLFAGVVYFAQRLGRFVAWSCWALACGALVQDWRLLAAIADLLH